MASQEEWPALSSTQPTNEKPKHEETGQKDKDGNSVTTPSAANPPTDPLEAERRLAKFCAAYSEVAFDTLLTKFPAGSTKAAAPVIDNSKRTRASELARLEAALITIIEMGLINHRMDLLSEKLVAMPETSAWEKIRVDALKAAREAEHGLLVKLSQANMGLAGVGVLRPRWARQDW
jgi:hypothetical protein